MFEYIKTKAAQFVGFIKSSFTNFIEFITPASEQNAEKQATVIFIIGGLLALICPAVILLVVPALAWVLLNRVFFDTGIRQGLRDYVTHGLYKGRVMTVVFFVSLLLIGTGFTLGGICLLFIGLLATGVLTCCSE